MKLTEKKLWENAKEIVKTYLQKKKVAFQEEFLNEDLYIPLRAEKRAYTDKSAPILISDNQQDKDKSTQRSLGRVDTVLNRWLADDNKNLLIIMGEYGTGKTTLMRYLLHQFASPHLETEEKRTIKNAAKRIPLFFPLRKFEGTIESMIANVCNDEYSITDFTFQYFEEKAGEIVTIFDGFNETTPSIETDTKKRNFSQIRNLNQKKIQFHCLF